MSDSQRPKAFIDAEQIVDNYGFDRELLVGAIAAQITFSERRRIEHPQLNASEADGQSRPDWQPIETAPRDGTRFLAYGSYLYPGDENRTDYIEVAWATGVTRWPWGDAEGEHPEDFFTHWLPLPTPPKEQR